MVLLLNQHKHICTVGHVDILCHPNFIFPQYTVSPYGSVNVTPSVINGFPEFDYISNCSALGGLNNEFIWTYLRTGEILINDSQINIDGARAQHGGEYKCQVSNPAGNDSDIFTLNSEWNENLLANLSIVIHCNVILIFFFIVAPTVLDDPISENVTITETIALNCTVEGYPPPNVFWFQNGSTIEESSRVTIREIELINETGFEDDFGIVFSELLISNADVNDTGDYLCTANSSIIEFDSQDSIEITVLVQGNNTISV